MIGESKREGSGAGRLSGDRFFLSKHLLGAFWLDLWGKISSLIVAGVFEFILKYDVIQG